jgi:hypothetical protein
VTERQIQYVIYLRNHKRFRVLMPNYTPAGWWECDMFGVTKAGYFHEFEIKLTVTDFRKDAKKKRQDSWQWIGHEQQTIPGKSKHESVGSTKGPAMFWYVTPEGLIDVAELPPWAGLQVITERHGRYAIVAKEAPRLHREKIADSIIRHSLSVCYYRYWSERQRCDQWQERAKAVQTAEGGGVA